MEAPQYSVKPKLVRAVVPELIKLVVLSAVFYAGILINLSLLDISPPFFINALIIIVLLLLIVLELVLVYVKNSKTSFQFYQDRIEITDHTQKSIRYAEVSNPAIKRNIFDRQYKTGTIVLQPKFKLEHVESPDEIFSYIQNMMAYQKA